MWASDTCAGPADAELSGGNASASSWPAAQPARANSAAASFFSEMTAGLHRADVAACWGFFERPAALATGHSWIVVKHDRVIKNAAHVIDLRTEGERTGGDVRGERHSPGGKWVAKISGKRRRGGCFRPVLMIE